MKDFGPSPRFVGMDPDIDQLCVFSIDGYCSNGASVFRLFQVYFPAVVGGECNPKTIAGAVLFIAIPEGEGALEPGKLGTPASARIPQPINVNGFIPHKTAIGLHIRIVHDGVFVPVSLDKKKRFFCLGWSGKIIGAG